MDTIKITNTGRLVHHFPVATEEGEGRDRVTVERYRVVLGDSADAQFFVDDDERDPRKKGQRRQKKIPNIARVPEDALVEGWEPTATSIHMPAPVVVMTVEQFAIEVFPIGSTNRGRLDSYISEGTVLLEESKAGALRRFEAKLSAEQPATEA